MGYVDDAIIKATDEGAKVINMSFGGLSEFVSSPDVDDAIEYAYNHGVTLVAASGNTSLFVGVTSNVYPASHPLVISAGSVDQSLSRSSFSVYGDSLDIVAPGRDIYSTTPNNNYGYNSGTSFSSPQVAAVAALLYSVKPDITPAEVKQALIEIETAYKIPSYAFDENGWNNEVGHGLLDAGAAVWSLIKISGSPVICSETIFTVENLPSGFNVVWELSDSFYETNCTLKGYPQNNMCTIQPHSTVAMEHGVLTAKLIHSGNIVKTLTKNVYVHIGFSGTYSYGSTTKPINLPTPLYTVPGSIVTVYCPNLRGMTLTHEAGVPTFWDYDEYNAILQVGIPSVGTTVVVVQAISESGCNNFVLPIIGTNNSSLLSGNFDMRMENGKITISFIPEEDDTVLHVLRKYCDLDYLEWTVEAYNVMSGEKMFMEKVTGPSYTFETYKWHSGVYAIRAIVGKEVMTNKIYIK